MKVRYHLLIGITLVIGLLIEVVPFGLASAISGLFVFFLAAMYMHYLAKSGLKTGFILVILVETTAIYLLAKPYFHYSVNQYDNETGKFVGKPHVHRIWEAGHVH